jgi:hypothetical protein
MLYPFEATKNEGIIVFQRSKWTPLNVDIANTSGPIQTVFVASERKFSCPHFSMTILGAGKYDYNQSFKKPLKQNLYFWILLPIFVSRMMQLNFLRNLF